MAKSPFKKSKQKYLIIFILLVFLVVSGLVIFFYLPTVNWSVYKSNKVALTFKHPKDWAISECSDPTLFPQMKIEEMVVFKTECDQTNWGQYENSIGDITVTQLSEDTDPRKITNSPFMDADSRTLEPTRIGNMDGYSLVVKPTSKIPYSKENVYYVVVNNLVYKIRLFDHTFYKESKEKTIKTFEKILSTFQF